MRSVLPAVLLIASATAVSAQEPAAVVREPAAAATPAAARPASPAEAVVKVEETKTESVVLKRTRFETVRTVATEETAARQTIPHNWWWTVGAIVLALLIVAVIL